MNKYGAKKKEVDGITFDSTAEANRYIDLKILQASKYISNMVLQPSYTLQDAFKTKKGKTIRAIVYTPDFGYYLPSGEFVVEEVKGHKTEAFLIRAKLFQYRYPDIELKLIVKGVEV